MTRRLKELKKRFRMTRSRALVKRLLREDRPIQLEIGGDKQRSGWVTLDVTKQCDIYWDLTHGLPFPDDSVDAIYSSHLLEHFSYEELQPLLAECLRVLVPGGSFSACVPNARLYIEAYMNGQELDSSAFFRPAFHFHSGIDFVNYMAYMAGHHKHMFDEENLPAILSRAGFRDAARRDFDPELDISARKFESIYAQAFKSVEPSHDAIRVA